MGVLCRKDDAVHIRFSIALVASAYWVALLKAKREWCQKPLPTWVGIVTLGVTPAVRVLSKIQFTGS